MVANHPESVAYSATRPRFIYISGCDGTGKSTQARLLLARLEALGRQPRHLWLRFPFLLSLPLLAYARWHGYSWHEQTGTARHGYWDFRHSWPLRALLPWVLLFDAMLAALRKVYLPLWLGRTIVCERFALDILVDLSVALDDAGLHRRLPGRLFLHLIPRGAALIVLDLDAETIRARRADLRADRRLEARLDVFRRLSAERSLRMLSSTAPLEELSRRIEEQIGVADER
jgi:thymidylate kinase